MNGIFKIVQIISEVPQVFSDCKQVSTSAVEKILAFAARFSDYNALLSRISMNLLWHGTEIYSDAALATKYYSAGDYYNAGLYAGLTVEVATQ